MYFLKTLHHKVLLAPESFGPGLSGLIQEKLYSDVEGSCSVRHGYIICVLSIDTIGNGVIQDGTGMAEFAITYKAIVFRPWRGQVVDAVIGTVNKMGFFASAGPLNIFVSSHMIPDDFYFDGSANPPCYLTTPPTGPSGSADSASRRSSAQGDDSLLNEDMLEYDVDGRGHFGRSAGQAHLGAQQQQLLLRIAPEEQCRIRLIGVKIDANEIVAIGTIKDAITIKR